MSVAEWDGEATQVAGLPPTTSVRAVMSIASHCPALTSVDLRGVTTLGSQAVTVALFFAANCLGLRSVDLSATGAVCDVEGDLEKLFRLQSIGLASNKLRNAEVLCSVLARASSAVQQLDLSGNLFDDASQLMLVSSVRHSRVLLQLDLSRNPPVPRKQAPRLLDTLMRNTSLRTFDAPFIGAEPAIKDYVSLMMRQNTALADAASANGSTTAVSFNSRRWTVIPSAIFSLETLVSLNFSDNRLAAVPLDILRLRALETLNISNNEIAFEALPVHLCSLPSLLRFSVRGNPFVEKIPNHVNWRDTTELLRFFLEVSQSSEPLSMPRPVRCLVLGDAQVGKSALVKTLTKSLGKDSGEASTSNVKLMRLFRIKKFVQDYAGDLSKILESPQTLSVGPSSFYSVCVLSGAPKYMPGHAFFLRNAGGLFLLCFSLTSPRSLLSLDFWINSIASKCTRAHMIIVGTNADRCANASAVMSSVREKYAFCRSVQLHGVLAVNALSRQAMEPLRALMASVADTVFRGNLMKPRPACFYAAASMLQATEDRVLPLARFYEICDACRVPQPLQEAALQSLCDSGTVLWFDLPAVRQWIVVDITWLSEALTSLLNTASTGVVTERQLDQTWPVHVFGLEMRPVLLDLLKEFGLLHRMATRGEYILPCTLSVTEVPLEQVARCHEVVHRQSDKCLTLLRVFRFESARPPGFMLQLVTRLLQMASTVVGHEVAVWRVGVCCVLEDSIDGTTHCVQVSSEGEFDVLLSLVTPDVTGKTMWLVAHAADALLRSWFPNVRYACFIRSATSGAEVSVEQVSRALQDIRRAESANKLSGTLREYEKLAPDLLLLRTKRLQLDSLTRVRKIGQGSFGVVYLATTPNGERVVVKEMLGSLLGAASTDVDSTSSSGDDDLSSFQNEAWMLSVLEHPRIIRLIGLTMRPKRALIMEWMELGDLADFLAAPNRDACFPWLSRLSVLRDICLAMDFAHRLRPPIVHRDLKSPNVFLTVTRRRMLIAKVADLGLASWLYDGDRGVGMPDNPTWLAPEVLDRQRHMVGAIDANVDVYAFGIIMWEVLHPGRQPFAHFTEHNTFLSALADEICGGMRPEPVVAPGAPQGYSDLMQQCWAQERTARGTFRTALASLGAIQARMVDADSSLVIGYQLHDMGVVGGNANAVLACSSSGDSLVSVDTVGLVSRIDMRIGRGASIARMPVVMRSPLVCSLPSGAVLVSSTDPDGGSVLSLVASALSDQDRSVFVDRLNGGHIFHLFAAHGMVCVLGEVLGRRGDAALVLLRADSLKPSAALDFVLWGSVLSVTHRQTRDHEWAVWLLMDTNTVLRFTLRTDTGTVTQLEDLLLGDSEQCVTRLAFVAPNTVWGLRKDSTVVVWESTTVASSFQVARAAGTLLACQEGSKGLAFIIGSHTISLWSVSGHTQLGVISTNGVSFHHVVLYPHLGGIGVAVGTILRTFVVAPEVLADQAIHAKRASRLSQRGSVHGFRRTRVGSLAPPAAAAPSVPTATAPMAPPTVTVTTQPPAEVPDASDDPGPLPPVEESSGSGSHSGAPQKFSIGELSSMGDSEDGLLRGAPHEEFEEDDGDSFGDGPSDETAVEEDALNPTSRDTVALLTRSLPHDNSAALDDDLARTGETLAHLLQQLEQQPRRDDERVRRGSDLDWSTTADEEWVGGEEWSKRSTVVLPQLHVSQHMLRASSGAAVEEASADTDDDDNSVEILPLDRESCHSDQGPLRQPLVSPPPPVSSSAPAHPTFKWTRATTERPLVAPPPPLTASPSAMLGRESVVSVPRMTRLSDSQPPDLPPELPPATRFPVMTRGQRSPSDDPHGGSAPPPPARVPVMTRGQRSPSDDPHGGSAPQLPDTRPPLPPRPNRAKSVVGSLRSKSGGFVREVALSEPVEFGGATAPAAPDVVMSARAIPAWAELPPTPDQELLSGYLRVKSRLGYKTRFFEMVDGDKVLFFEKQECKGQIRISEITHIDVSQAESDKATFTLFAGDATHELLASSAGECNLWITKLTQLNPAIALITEPHRRPRLRTRVGTQSPPSTRAAHRSSSSALALTRSAEPRIE